MAKLNAPLIDTKLPAQAIKDKLSIPYRLPNSVGLFDISKIRIQIKNVMSGSIVASVETTNFQSKYEGQPGYYNCIYENSDTLPLDFYNYYKLQIVFVNNSNEEGYYSSVGIFKTIEIPATEIIITPKSLDNCILGDISTFTFGYSGMLKEPIVNYHWKMFKNSEEVANTEETFLYWNKNEAEVYLEWQPEYNNYQDGDRIEVIFYYTTINSYRDFLSTGVKTYDIQNASNNPNLNSGFSIYANYQPEEGSVKITLNGGRNPQTNNDIYFIYRQEKGDDTWRQIGSIYLPTNLITNISGTLFTDYTVENGKSYRYTLIQYGQRFVNSTDYVFIDLEHIYLSDEEKQLCIQFNPQVSSFKKVLQEQKVDTIGGKYPYFFRNGNIDYREISISGLLSYLLDTKGDFSTKFAAGPLVRTRTPDATNFVSEFSTALTAENFKKEKDFKLEVEKWLMNGKPKLFRSAQEGNYIIRLMNISLSPNTTVGRMLHTFSATGYEIDNFNTDTIKKYKFLQKGTLGNLFSPIIPNQISKGSYWEWFWEPFIVVPNDEQATNARVEAIVNKLPQEWYVGKELSTKITNTSAAPFSSQNHSWLDTATIIPYSIFVAFFRQMMLVDDINLLSGFKLSVRYDENVKIYVNGALIFEANGFNDTTYVEKTLPLTGFQNGMNCVCVKIDNRFGGAGMDLSLTPIYK